MDIHQSKSVHDEGSNGLQEIRSDEDEINSCVSDGIVCPASGLAWQTTPPVCNRAYICEGAFPEELCKEGHPGRIK
eukprot:3246200-Alexandrium_andersonii.AAC.1